MSRLAVKGVDYLFTEFPTSREFFRLTRGVVDGLHELDVDGSFLEKITPIGDLAQGLDGFFSLKKSLEGVDVVILSAGKLCTQSGSKNLYELFNNTVKLATSVLGALKWFAVVGGVTVLSPYSKSFGYIKSICSVYSAVVMLSKNGGTAYSKCTSLKFDREMLESTALVVVSLCSIWLNGIGGASSWIGIKTYLDRGLDYPKPWTFAAANILANVIVITKNVAKHGES